MESQAADIPIIDISYLIEKYSALNCNYDDFCQDLAISSLKDQVTVALSTWGFLYLKGHGLKQEAITDSFRYADDFFAQPLDQKLAVARTPDDNFGYVPMAMETFESSRPPDLKECFNFVPKCNKENLMKENHGTVFNAGMALFGHCVNLVTAFFRLLDLVICAQSHGFLSSVHKNWGNYERNATTLRFLYYPPLASKADVKVDQLRCGEHADYGTITFLFQDDAPGLQVLSPSGEYLFAEPKSGCIIVNIGDMFEIWSAGRFRSTRHRVLVPADISQARRSIAFFVHPDNDVVVECLDGSEKYAKVNAFQYVLGKFKATYK